MEQAGDYPDIIVGCTGGGSNLAGLMFPFLGQQLRGGHKIDIIGCEPLSCPSFTKGTYAYDQLASMVYKDGWEFNQVVCIARR